MYIHIPNFTVTPYTLSQMAVTSTARYFAYRIFIVCNKNMKTLMDTLVVDIFRCMQCTVCSQVTNPLSYIFHVYLR